ncbi:MAG: hypothetical protein HY582_00275, partial [Candidatus Omnitrophica bacterium]|nr:hypothetical protein [Candidatus Omnitrophota bacterium]
MTSNSPAKRVIALLVLTTFCFQNSVASSGPPIVSSPTPNFSHVQPVTAYNTYGEEELRSELRTDELLQANGEWLGKNNSLVASYQSSPDTRTSNNQRRSELRSERLVGDGQYAIGRLMPGFYVPQWVPRVENVEGAADIDATRQLILYFRKIGLLGLINFLEGSGPTYPKLEFLLPKKVWVYREGEKEPLKVGRNNYFQWRHGDVLHFTVPIDGKDQKSVLTLYGYEDSYRDRSGQWRFHYAVTPEVEVNLPEQYRAYFLTDEGQRLSVPFSAKSVRYVRGETEDIYRFAALDGSQLELVRDPNVVLVYPEVETKPVKVSFKRETIPKREPLSEDFYSIKREARQNPKNLSNWKTLIPLVMRQGQYLGLVKLIQVVLKYHPNDIDLLNWLGRSYFYLRNFDKAREFTFRAMEQKASNQTQQAYAGETLELIEKESPIEEEFSKPDKGVSNRSWIDQKTPAKAELLARSKVPSSDSVDLRERADRLVEQAQAYIHSKNYDNAVQVARAAAELNPANAYAWGLWLFSLAMRRRFKEALEIGQHQALTHHPQDTYILNQIARSAAMDNQLDLAEELAQRALRLATSEKGSKATNDVLALVSNKRQQAVYTSENLTPRSPRSELRLINSNQLSNKSGRVSSLLFARAELRSQSIDNLKKINGIPIDEIERRAKPGA